MGAVAAAQPSNFYVFAGYGGVTHRSRTARIGMGGFGYEHVLRKTVGIAGEIGGIGSNFDGFATLSINGSFHTSRGRGGRIDPFLTAGYTLAVEEGSANLFNFGGGMNYWFHRRLGLRLEIRDHVLRDYGSSWHYWGIRAGLAIH